MEELLDRIKHIADECGMDVFVVGSKAHYKGDEFWPDGRLLKICPKGVRSRVLIEIEAGSGGYLIYKHRTSELTARYKGRKISSDWLVDFVKHNQAFAKDIAAANPPPEPPPSIEPAQGAKPMSQDEIEKRKQERHIVRCFCRGEVEDCAYCNGAGFYETDGLGRRT